LLVVSAITARFDRALYVGRTLPKKVASLEPRKLRTENSELEIESPTLKIRPGSRVPQA
jgi:hypothetical protein